MSRIQPVTTETASADQKSVLESVRRAMGGVPNILATMAQSAAVANAYLAFNKALSRGALSSRLREQIALAVSEANACEYCLSAHSVLGSAAGLTEQEIIRARRAGSGDPRADAALAFAAKVVASRGIVGDEEIEKLRAQGYSDGEIVEIVAEVALTIFTNYFNHIAGTEVDFPAVAKLSAA